MSTEAEEPAIVSPLYVINRITDDDHSVDLIDVFTAVFRQRWLVLACGLAAALLMLVYLNTTTYRYSAELKVTAAQGASTGGLASSLQKFGGLASIANIQLPQDSSSIAFLRFGEMLHSPDIARIVALNPTVMHVLFAREWDSIHRRWFEPRTPLAALINSLKSIVGIPVYTWTPPDWHRVEEYLDRWVVVTVEQKRPVIVIAYSDRDPVFARTFVDLLNKAADEELRRRSLLRSEQNIAYLSDRLRTVTLAEHRTALSEAIGEQERTAMMAQAGAPFSAEPIGATRVSSRPTSPLPAVYLALAFVGGLLIGALGVLVRNYLRFRSNPTVRAAADLVPDAFPR